MPRGRATRLVKLLRLSLLVCAFAGTTFAAALAQSIAVEIARAEVTHDQMTGRPVISIQMNPTSARAFADLTRKNVGRSALIVIDGHVMYRPVIRSPIVGGEATISGDFGVEEAQSLARRLSDGTAKLTIAIVSNGGLGK